MSQTVVALPRLIELRSQNNKKLLRIAREEGEVKGFVQFTGEHVGSSDVKFEVHSSETEDGLVHIRSCYTNKYLVLDKNDWIGAKADKPEEDQSKRSCTLFRPTSVDGNPKNIRLTNVHLKNYLCLWPVGADAYYACVCARYSEPDFNTGSDLFNVIDWQSLVFLPKYVALKGDNGLFLRAHAMYVSYYDSTFNYLEFHVPNVEDSPLLVGNEVVQASNGNLSFRNLHWDKYWRFSSYFIWADATTCTSDETQFEPVKVSNNTIALRNVRNKLFCTRMTSIDCLTSDSKTINKLAKFEVSEPIMSRKIENIRFRLMDARIYDESVMVMRSSSFANGGNTPQEQTLDLSYTDRKSSTWNTNISMKANIETSFKVGIPFIEESEIKLGYDYEIGGEFSWGETKEEKTNFSITPKVTIPGKTKVTLRLITTRGTCDVPFSYTQHDVFYTGETVTTEMDDGVYTGVNNYSSYTESKQEPLEIKDPLHVATAGFKKVGKVSMLTGEITPV